MDKDARVTYFENRFLDGTCFHTLEELLSDKTLIAVNAPRALIATNLVGVWRGFNAGLDYAAVGNKS